MAAFPEYFPHADSLDRYIRTLADAMGLKDWDVRLSDDALDDGNAGGCRVPYGRKIAKIRLAEHDTIESLRRTIVHELLHAHLEPIDWQIHNIKPAVSELTFDVWRGGFVDALEVACDAIAWAWAEHLPLPTADAQEAA